MIVLLLLLAWLPAILFALDLNEILFTWLPRLVTVASIVYGGLVWLEGLLIIWRPRGDPPQRMWVVYDRVLLSVKYISISAHRSSRALLAGRNGEATEIVRQYYEDGGEAPRPPRRVRPGVSPDAERAIARPAAPQEEGEVPE